MTSNSTSRSYMTHFQEAEGQICQLQHTCKSIETSRANLFDQLDDVKQRLDKEKDRNQRLSSVGE
jgi:hypothetical protein